ncbi:MAG TPA: winged helix-turn-helix transcriptional regulator [Methanocella sp.]|jgi:predicted transcriptional regulator
MERSKVFEAVLVVLAIGLAGLLCLAIVSPTATTARSWETAANGNVEYMFVGSNDTLYAFSGNNITAVKCDGSIAWTLDVPSQWQVLNNWIIPLYSYGISGICNTFVNMPVVDERSGTVYLFVTHRLTAADIDMTNENPGLSTIDFPSMLMAITPDGDIAWTYNFSLLSSAASVRITGDSYRNRMVAIEASGDREYLFHDYSEDVLDRNGRLLFTIPNVSAQVSVDDQGHIYAVGTYQVDTGTLLASTLNKTYIGLNPMGFNGYSYAIMPSSMVNAYGPDGSLQWSRDIGEAAVKPPISIGLWQQYNTLPLYVNGTLYVPLDSGVAALDTGGDVKWVRHLNGSLFSLFGLMPADTQCNVYLENLDAYNDGNDKYIVRMIASDGNVSPAIWDFDRNGYNGGYFMADHPVPVAGKDGVVYALASYPSLTEEMFNNTLDTLQYSPDSIEAMDLKDSRILWNFTIPGADRHAATLNESNAGDIVKYLDVFGIQPPAVQKNILAYPGNNVTYVSYDFVIYDNPVVYNVSRCFYARGIYALDKEGKLLWEIQPDGRIVSATAGNGTIYYSTSNGQLGGGTTGIATGFALAALAYFFLRFFMVGTVTRARSRLEQNENRNAVLRYVADNPGATAADVVKGLGMNTGTIRYHLFILTLNHKIATHKEDDKYLRYFRNAGAYTETERTLVSLLRREPLRRTLETIASKPGLSGSALARELNLSATAANRHVATLAEKGIIEQVPVPEKGYGYVIKAEHREMISRLMASI